MFERLFGDRTKRESQEKRALERELRDALDLSRREAKDATAIAWRRLRARG